MTGIKQGIRNYLIAPVSIFPLIVFRIGFGFMMAASAIRFWDKGWIEELYLKPQFHFHYYGFHWVQVLPENGMYFAFVLLILLSLFIAFGLFYRLSIIAYFLLFTYVELIDKSLYLNHYYFISIISFLMIFLPANQTFSLDKVIFKRKPQWQVPRFAIGTIRLQLALVYFFAGIAKLNHDWLIEALPLSLWLPARANLPLIGPLLDLTWFPFVMSWAGVAYDLSIPFLLMWRKSRPYAYVAVIVFHIFTYILFQIGMFPWIMIVSTLIFFDGKDYQKLFSLVKFKASSSHSSIAYTINKRKSLGLIGLFVFFLLQISLPLRHFAYAGNVGWHETGFRYSWNVMRVEKTGYAEFHCKNPKTGRQWIAYPNQYLSVLQEKQMTFQPDMILEFAHFLDKQTEDDIEVYADVFVSLNSKAAKQFVNPKTDLSKESDYLFCKFHWILPEIQRLTD